MYLWLLFSSSWTKTISNLNLVSAQECLWTTFLRFKQIIHYQIQKLNSKGETSNPINLNFKSDCLQDRLLERRIIIPFHEKICSWCHSIPHAKVVKLDKTAAILKTLNNLNDAGMVESRDLGWGEHLLYRYISDFVNSARAEYLSTFCIFVCF